MAINVPAIALARSVVAPDNREVLWEDTSNMNLPFYERLKSYDSNSGQWRMVTQLPLELLNSLKKVDGDGSGLDANFLQGRTVNDIIQLAKDGSFTLPNGFIFIGNNLGEAEAKALSGDATLQSNGNLTLASSGVTAGTYNLASLTIDAKGRITSASSYTITVNDIPELPQSKITNLTTDLSARELLANKENSVIDTSTTKYPTVNLLKIGLDTKEPTITAGTTGQYWRGDKTFQTLDKTAVGLSNVDNTSDANKPISSATALEFTNVYNEVSTKANNYVDIANIISGYILTDTDAGKLITNSGINVRSLNIPSGLALPNNVVFVKGRVSITPASGVVVELPDGTTITNSAQFACLANTQYVLHRKEFGGDEWILLALGSAKNLGNSDLEITDTIRELQVATGGTFQIVTNDPNNSTLFKVGENSNERFSEIELNSITYDVTTAEPNPTNNGAGIITRINPNEYELESRSDIGNVGTKRSRIYTSPGEVILEKTNAGKLTLNSLGASNTFEDLRATKKGLEYSADYSANFSVRSLVDKAYVDANGGAILYDNVSPTPLTKRNKYRVLEFLEVIDDALNEESVFQIRASKLSEFTSSDIIDVAGVFKLSLAENKLYFGNNQGLAEQKTLTEVFGNATEEISNVIFHVVDNKVELLVPTGEIIVGDGLNRGRSATIGEALDTLAKLVGDIFKNGIDNKLQLNVPEGYVIRGNANAEGEAQKLIQGNNKVLVTNGSGVEEEVDLVSFFDLLTVTGVTADGVLNTIDLGGTARGVLGGWKITDIVVKNTTANAVTINIGSTLGGTDIANAVVIGANGFVDVPVGTALFSETVEQALYASSANWNSANLIIKFSVKKVF